MDGISAAASIIGIATAGVQISIRLITLSNQVGTAPSRIRLIGNDVSLTSGVLQQLGDLMHQQDKDENSSISIFSKGGLLTTQASATTCKSIFEQLEEALKKASRQIRESGAGLGTQKVALSKTERLRFPFLQPNLDSLRGELTDARGTLLLILQVTTLAYSKKLAESNRPAVLDQEEQAELMRSIIAIHRGKMEEEGKDPEKDLKNVHVTKPVANDMNGSVVPPIHAVQDPDLDLDHANADGGTPSAYQDVDREITGSNDNASKPSNAAKPVQETSSQTSLHSHIAVPSKRPPVCRFPWSSEGKDKGKVRSRSRRSAPSRRSSVSSNGPRRRGRRRSRSGSRSWSILSTRSRDVEIVVEPVKEAWLVSPTVRPIQSSYQIHWIAERLPLKTADVEDEYDRLQRKSKKSIIEKMVQLTNKEREFIDEWFSDELKKQNVKLYVVAITLEKIKAPDLVLTNMPKRRIRLIVERQPLENFERATMPGRPWSFSEKQDTPTGLRRPTFLKVNRKFMEPEILDMYSLPWEWDDKNPHMMIIRKWLPDKDTEILFEATRKLRESRGQADVMDKKGSSSRWRPVFDRIRRRRPSTPKGSRERPLRMASLESHVPRLSTALLQPTGGRGRLLLVRDKKSQQRKHSLTRQQRRPSFIVIDNSARLGRSSSVSQERRRRRHHARESRSPSPDMELKKRLERLEQMEMMEKAKESEMRRSKEMKVKEAQALEESMHARLSKTSKPSQDAELKQRLQGLGRLERVEKGDEAEAKAKSPIVIDTDTEEAQVPPQEAATFALEEDTNGESEEKIIDDLLGKYTTLFDQPPKDGMQEIPDVAPIQ